MLINSHYLPFLNFISLMLLSKESAIRLLRCFCGCTALTEGEVQRIYQLSVQATLIDRQAVQIFRTYLALYRSGDKSLAEQYLDVYEQCNVLLLQRDEKILTLDELDELSELGLPYYLECDLRDQIRTGETDNITRCLLRIQGECRNEIEISQEYKSYKDAILSKLRQRNT